MRRLRDMAIVLAVAGTAAMFGGEPEVPDAMREVASDCMIKGNISIDTGRRLYHVPGSRDYAITRISPEHGERWFCSEAEARAAGWSRAVTR